MTAYDTLLALPNASAVDYMRAGYLAAQVGQANRAREIFRLAEEQFPNVADLQRLKGWTLINLNDPAEALAAFLRYEPLLAAGDSPEPGGIAGLAVARWQTGDKEGAVREYQRVIAANAAYADAAKIKASDYTGIEKNLMLTVLAETLHRHPELVPKPSSTPGS